MRASDYLRAVVRHWPLVLVFLVLGLGAGYVGAKRPAPVERSFAPPAPPTYQTSAIMNLPGGGDPSGLSLDSIAYLATSGPVATLTAQVLHGSVAASTIRSEVQVTPRDALGILTVTATAATPRQSAAMANAFGQQIITYLNDGLLASWKATLASDLRQITALAKVVSSLRSQSSNSITQAELSQAQSQYISQSVSYQQLEAAGPQHTNLSVLQPAAIANATAVFAASSRPAKSSHSLIPTSRKKLMLLAGLVGLLVGLGAALLRDRLDTRIKTREEAERVFGLPVLGELPSGRAGKAAIVLLDAPLSAAAESYRMLQTALSAAPNAHGSTGSRAVLVSSPYEVDGKDQIFANLSASFAEAGKTVALLAMDSFDQSLPALLTPGQRSAPVVSAPVDQLRLGAGQEQPELVKTRIESVSLVLDGVRPGIGTHRTERHLRAIGDARRIANLVLVDTPPVLLTHDAAELAPAMDVVVLLCPLGELKPNEATRAVEVLRRVGAPLEGVVLMSREPFARRIRRLLRGDSTRPTARMTSDRSVPVGSTVAPRQPVRVDASAAAAVTALDPPNP